MYRITKDIIEYLIINSRKPKLPELTATTEHPFVPDTTRAIGIIDPTCVMGSDFDYLVECPHPVLSSANIPVAPTAVEGYWLYRKGELGHPPEPILLPKFALDPNSQDPNELIDATDCCLRLPSSIEKLTCPKITSLERLFELEPLLLDCLKPNREKTNGK